MSYWLDGLFNEFVQFGAFFCIVYFSHRPFVPLDVLRYKNMRRFS